MDEIIQLARYSITAPFPSDRKLALDSLKDRLRGKPANGGADGLSLIFSIIAKEKGDEGICNAALSYVPEQDSLQDIAEHASLWSIRVSAAERLEDTLFAQLVYDEAARKAEDSSVRARAALRLNDQEALTEIAQNDDCLEVRLEAAIRLTNETLRQRVIAEVGTQADNRVTVVKALEYLTDQAMLTHILLNNQDSIIRLANVGRLTDQNALAQIIRESNDPDVCTRAIERLNDQAILAGVVLSDVYPNSRRTALGRITDQNALAQIIRESNDPDVCTRAIERLNDQAILAEVALSHVNPNSRRTALERITDQNALARIIRESNDPDVCVQAIEQLNDQAILARVALSDVDLNSRWGAVGKLTDQIQITRVVKNVKEFSVFCRAIALMNDQNVLVDIARKHLQWEYRREAVWRIDSQEILVDIARNDSHLMVRQAAAEQSQHKAIMQEVYACVAQQTDTDRAGIEALKKLMDQAAIYSTAQHAIRQEVRLMAISMLNDTKFLANVAQHNRCGETAMTAFRVLVSRPDYVQADIKRIALIGHQDAVCNAAVSKLQDMAALVQVANESACRGARKEAVLQLYNRSGLGRIDLDGLENQDWNGLTKWIRKNLDFNEIDRNFMTNAAGRLHGPRLAIELCLLLLVIHPRVQEQTKLLIVNNTTNSDVLSLIVEHAQEKDVRCTALGKITNRQAFVSIAEGNSPWIYRYQAAVKIEEAAKKQELLKKLAICAPDQQNFLKAIEGISDLGRLAEVVKTSQFHDAVQEIVNRIASGSDRELSQSLLFECVQNATEQTTRIAAVECMTDRKQLNNIATNKQQSFYVRKVAAKMLQDDVLVQSLNAEEAESLLSPEKRTLPVDDETQKKIQMKTYPHQDAYHDWFRTY